MKRSVHLWLVWMCALNAGGWIVAAAEPSSSIHLLNAAHDFYLGETIELELSTANSFGKAVIDGLTSNRSTTLANLQLQISGVPMVGIPAHVAAGTDDSAIIVSFTLRRDSQNTENRDAWDRLLEKTAYSGNQLSVALSSGTGLPQISAEKLKFAVRAVWRELGVGIVAFVLFILLMRWAVSSGMLREAGPLSAYSLGRTQMAFWGLLVALSFLALFVVTAEMERIPGQTLILMGISGVTGLGAVLIGSSKSDNAGTQALELQKDLDKFKKKQAELNAQIQTLEKLSAVTVMLPAETEELDKSKKTCRDLNVQVQDFEKPSSRPLTFGATPAQASELAGYKADFASIQAAILDNERKIESLKAAADPSKSHGKGFAWLNDIASDANGLSFPRFQVCLWTLILGIVFVARVCTRMTMPEFEPTLLTVMGISNGLYLGFKIPEKAG